MSLIGKRRFFLYIKLIKIINKTNRFGGIQYVRGTFHRRWRLRIYGRLDRRTLHSVDASRSLLSLWVSHLNKKTLTILIVLNSRNHNTLGATDQDPANPDWPDCPSISRDVLLLRYIFVSLNWIHDWSWIIPFLFDRYTYIPYFYARFHRVSFSFNYCGV